MALFLGGGFLLFFFFNPAEHSFFLPCPFKLITGYHCPGCGSQRALHQLFHGDISGAFGYNPLMVLSLPLIVGGFGIMAYNFLFDTSHRLQLFYSNTFIYLYFGVAVLYWIVRNIPFPPFSYLAPSG
ncbi:DUF2752 domain-containing protein [Ulvibacter antarcticus]|uniref:Uncharacterized protein DUF2752 n=1 Tax=Ulvibacter antarcticus TaxID=442714 RepID=A0A3L9YYR1_9FLAO|nr:DUF2752 domain-containing protein [Ulvibacter antarcticus]RMA65861.1 uncharacterized protein DUF2752 [Ulvibacter antarcticus]